VLHLHEWKANLLFNNKQKMMRLLLEEMEWLNVKTVELKLPNLEKAGKWLVAPIRQEKEPN